MADPTIHIVGRVCGENGEKGVNRKECCTSRESLLVNWTYELAEIRTVYLEVIKIRLWACVVRAVPLIPQSSAINTGVICMHMVSWSMLIPNHESVSRTGSLILLYLIEDTILKYVQIDAHLPKSMCMSYEVG